MTLATAKKAEGNKSEVKKQDPSAQSPHRQTSATPCAGIPCFMGGKGGLNAAETQSAQPRLPPAYTGRPAGEGAGASPQHRTLTGARPLVAMRKCSCGGHCAECKAKQMAEDLTPAGGQPLDAAT